ncbi:mitochondrial carrier domain-containing protein [Pilobolus umbonatus]|nr:mitochondrial carrier domain-containing protein [Pilobolus umbonatus]
MSKKEDHQTKLYHLPIRSVYEELLWANRTILAASSAAIVGVISGYPFDSIKTRLQTQPYDSISACIKQTYKEEGIRGFFRGVLPPLITVSIIKSISFSVYEETKCFCKKVYPEYYNLNTILSTMALSTTAGAVSGAFIATLSCPFELVKIQKQLEYILQTSSISTGVTVMRSDLKPTINRTVGVGIPVSPTAKPPLPDTHLNKKQNYTSTSSWYSAREIMKKKGFFGLYSGFNLHLVRDTIGTGVYFGGYETIKYILSGQNKTAGPATQFISGGLCGLMCWVVVFPLDLVKSMIQKEIGAPNPKYKNTKECINDIYQNGGLRGFYRGIAVTLIRAFPIHSLNFLMYEQTLLLIRHLSHHPITTK